MIIRRIGRLLFALYLLAFVGVLAPLHATFHMPSALGTRAALSGADIAASSGQHNSDQCSICTSHGQLGASPLHFVLPTMHGLESPVEIALSIQPVSLIPPHSSPRSPPSLG
ncbi:MAG TPA: hypothetical protein VMS71_05005 [Candidatus Acidoferrum sp.]|nr:hypothetical protein [Candidatus Acidoferrum sp.]